MDCRTLNQLISKSERAQELLALHQLHGHAFGHVNLATCWSRLGRVSPAERGELQANDGARLLAVCEQTSLQVQTFDARCVSITVHALARLAVLGPAWRSLWVELEEVALARVHGFEPQHLANTAWSFAKAGHAAPALFDQHFARRCDALADEFNVKGLCQLHQWHLWYVGERACSNGLLGAALLARCDAAFPASKNKPL